MPSSTLMYRTLAHIGTPPDSEPVCWKRVAGIVAGAVALSAFTALVLEHTLLATFTIWAAGLTILSIFLYMTVRAAPAERAGLIAALLLTLQVFLFFIFYQQQYTSITLFALRNVDPRFTFFGHTLFTWSAAQFQALSAIWIIMLGPFLVLLYNRLGNRGNDAPVAVKFTLGFAAVAASFFLLAVSGQFAVDGRVSSWFVVWSYALYALGDLLISGLGLAMISRYVPIRVSGFMMGAWRSPVPGQCGGQPRPVATRRHGGEPIVAAVYAPVQRAWLGSYRRNAAGAGVVAVAEEAVARSSKPYGSAR
ncbi:hypothetical protein [Pseudomonas sp. NPDC089401]|uniref:POT-type proton-dependent oligopeptide transporter n=1 Tax=Pseudomonas sp. NPDC089401 TaxID=3364462 RepID=UPI00381BE7AB